MTRRLCGSASRGIALVEFSLVLPLLLVLALGAVDLGRGLISYVELEEAAQEGALYGSFAPSDPSLIEARIRSSSTGLVNLSDPAAVDVVVDCPDADLEVGVTLQHTLQLFTPIVGQLLGGSIPLSARSVGTNFTDASCTPSP